MQQNTYLTFTVANATPWDASVVVETKKHGSASKTSYGINGTEIIIVGIDKPVSKQNVQILIRKFCLF